MADNANRSSKTIMKTAPAFPLKTAITLSALLIVVWLAGNEPLFILLNGALNILPENIWQFITTLADPWVAPLLTFVILFRQVDFVRALLICSVLAVIANYSLKHGFDLPRPNHVMPPEQYILIGPDVQSPSFPSGHTITIFAMMGVISFWNQVSLTSRLLFTLATFIALSRIAVGVHWPMDLIFGSLVGWLVAWFAVSINCRLESDMQPYLKMALYSVVLLGAIWAVVNKTPYPAAQWFSTAVALFAIAYSLRSLTELMHRQKG